MAYIQDRLDAVFSFKELAFLCAECAVPLSRSAVKRQEALLLQEIKPQFLRYTRLRGNNKEQAMRFALRALQSTPVRLPPSRSKLGSRATLLHAATQRAAMTEYGPHDIVEALGETCSRALPSKFRISQQALDATVEEMGEVDEDDTSFALSRYVIANQGLFQRCPALHGCFQGTLPQVALRLVLYGSDPFLDSHITSPPSHIVGVPETVSTIDARVQREETAAVPEFGKDLPYHPCLPSVYLLLLSKRPYLFVKSIASAPGETSDIRLSCPQARAAEWMCPVLYSPFRVLLVKANGQGSIIELEGTSTKRVATIDLGIEGKLTSLRALEVNGNTCLLWTLEGEHEVGATVIDGRGHVSFAPTRLEDVNTLLEEAEKEMEEGEYSIFNSLHCRNHEDTGKCTVFTPLSALLSFDRFGTAVHGGKAAFDLFTVDGAMIRATYRGEVSAVLCPPPLAVTPISAPWFCSYGRSIQQ